MSNNSGSNRVYSHSDLGNLSDEGLYSELKRCDNNIQNLREQVRRSPKDRRLGQFLRDAEIEHCYLKRELDHRRGRREAHAKYLTELSRKKRAERPYRGGDRPRRDDRHSSRGGPHHQRR